MQWYEILIIALAAVFVLGVAVWRVIKMLKGQGGCDCGGNCASCKGCSSQKNEKK